jgi:hypothetical protein
MVGIVGVLLAYGQQGHKWVYWEGVNFKYNMMEENGSFERKH